MATHTLFDQNLSKTLSNISVDSIPPDIPGTSPCPDDTAFFRVVWQGVDRMPSTIRPVMA